jgi:hypothetical protein
MQPSNGDYYETVNKCGPSELAPLSSPTNPRSASLAENLPDAVRLEHDLVVLSD